MDFNIIYFASVGQNYGGVEQKIISQFDALVRERSNVALYLVCSAPPNGMFTAEINKRSGVKVLLNTSGRVKNPFYRRREKFQLISNALKNYNADNTIVYFRHPDSDFHFLNFLKSTRNYKIVTEHQEIENTLKIGKFSDNRLSSIIETFYGRKVRKRIFAFVGVTPEITDFEINESGQLNKMKITIGNGIDVQKYPVRKINKEHPEVIKILFVGGGYRRHGLDRIISGVANYINSGNKPYKIMLRVAGEGREMNKYIKLVRKLGLNECVNFIGYKNVDSLNKYFDWADLGLGSLGSHRVGLNYTSNLKAREYFSRGIPFFMSSIDEDLTKCSKYVLKVTPDDSPVNMEDVIDFAISMRSDSEHPGIMRDYATANLDWSIKMKKLIAFLESLFSSSQ